MESWFFIREFLKFVAIYEFNRSDSTRNTGDVKHQKNLSTRPLHAIKPSKIWIPVKRDIRAFEPQAKDLLMQGYLDAHNYMFKSPVSCILKH
jgi:hypothetical protein